MIAFSTAIEAFYETAKRAKYNPPLFDAEPDRAAYAETIRIEIWDNMFKRKYPMDFVALHQLDMQKACIADSMEGVKAFIVPILQRMAQDDLEPFIVDLEPCRDTDASNPMMWRVYLDVRKT